MNPLKKSLDERLESVGIELDEEIKQDMAMLSDRYGMVLLMAYDFLRWTKEKGHNRDILGFKGYIMLEIAQGLELNAKTLADHFEKKWDAQKTPEWKNKIDYMEAWDEVR